MPTRGDVSAALDRLATVYHAPKGISLATLGDVWFQSLHDLAAPDLRTAVDTYLRSAARFFPKPGEIRSLLPRRNGDEHDGTLLGRYRFWQFGSGVGDGEPCPVCGSVLAQTESGRLAMHHDHQRHVEAGIGYVGPRTGPVDAQGRTLALTGPRDDRWEAP